MRHSHDDTNDREIKHKKSHQRRASGGRLKLALEPQQNHENPQKPNGQVTNHQHRTHHNHHNNLKDNYQADDDEDDDDEDEADIVILTRHKSKGRKHKIHTKKLIDENDYGNDEENEDDYDEYDVDTMFTADALNNTKKAQVDVVVFNRVPKVGSQSLMQLMIRLGNKNGFQHSRDKGKAHETIMLKPPEQKKLIKEIYDMPRPRIYSQHVAYINFTQHHLPKPIYINLVRDPIERIRSWHYYVRAEWYYRDLKAKLGDKAPPMPPKEFMEMDLDTCVKTGDYHCQFNQMEINNKAGDHRRQTLFFCGQNRKLCMPFNSKAAMQKAKRTVEEEYAVVGTWEDTNITLSVLEHYIPRFFKNAKQIYYLGKDKLSKINKNNVTRPISDETRMILSKNLTNEIEFYEFCKQRLYLQYNAISDGKTIDNDDYLLIPDDETDDYAED